MGYDGASERYEIDGIGLHAGWPIDVIKADGSRIETRIEHDENGWYLVGIENRNLSDLNVELML